MNEYEFEVVSKYKEKGIFLPARATKGSAGFDIAAAQDTIVHPYAKDNIKPTLIPTGIKAKFPEGVVLLLFNRSSNPIKRNLVLANSVGVIDSDYYNNPNNEGEIFGSFYNFGNSDYTIKKGERIMQGIFIKYENFGIALGERTGGFGSTD